MLTILVLSSNYFEVVNGTIILAQVEISVGETGVSGVLNLTQASESDPVRIIGRLTGLQPEGKHGFHVHASGNLTGNITHYVIHVTIKTWAEYRN